MKLLSLVIANLFVCSIVFAQTWDEFVYRAIIDRGKGRFADAAEAFMRAADLSTHTSGLRYRRDSAQWYWDACIQYARAKRPNASFDALDRAIDAGLADVDRLESNKRLQPLRADARWSEAVARMRKAEDAYASTLRYPELRAELLGMWKSDQALVGNRDRQTIVTEANTEQLSAIIDRIGWPTVPLVGKEGSWVAWAITQHSGDISFQKTSLALIGQAVKAGTVDPAHYAELHDRLHRDLRLKQAFGMATTVREGTLGFYAIEDEHKVDDRRAAIGLPPLRVFANISSIKYEKPSERAAAKETRARRIEALNLYEQAEDSLHRSDSERAIRQFEKALAIHGLLTSLEIYEFAANFSLVHRVGESSPDQALLRWLKLLVDRDWLGSSRMLVDKRLAPIRNRLE